MRNKRDTGFEKNKGRRPVVERAVSRSACGTILVFFSPYLMRIASGRRLKSYVLPITTTGTTIEKQKRSSVVHFVQVLQRPIQEPQLQQRRRHYLLRRVALLRLVHSCRTTSCSDSASDSASDNGSISQFCCEQHEF
jgi:hypothetical protein